MKKLVFLLILPLFLGVGCVEQTKNQPSRFSTTSTPYINQELYTTSTNVDLIEDFRALIDRECIADTSNVYQTECTIMLSDRKAAEREWKQKKIELLKHPEINVYDFFGILSNEQTKIKKWRENFEKFRDIWCDAVTSFRSGSFEPYDVAACKLEIDMRAIKELNNIYYEIIMKNVYDSDGIKDFEPTQADIDKLIKVNTTKRGCIWAGEEDPNCVSPI